MDCTEIAVPLLLPFALLLGACSARESEGGDRSVIARDPNIVIVLADDQGYRDLGVYGARGFSTPRIDRLAEEGVRFTDFHVAQPVCSASRAAILTGCYPNRLGLHGALDHNARHGIAASETTLAEFLRAKGYATAVFGKWHLGHHPCFLPLQHGFDEYAGVPYSHDMWPKHPENPNYYPPLPWIEGDRTEHIVEDPAELTEAVTERAVDFVRRHADQPFFLYVPHPLPHVPLGVGSDFVGRTERGLYGDVIEEIDASTGRILDALEEAGVADDTWVIYLSDNGPWLSYGDHAGSAEGLREGKGTSFEGGTRVPCVMRWPRGFSAGQVCDRGLMSIDVFATIAEALGLELPATCTDSVSFLGLLRGEDLPDRAYAHYYHEGALEAVSRGRYKLVFPHRYRTLAGRPGGTGGIPAKYEAADTPEALFDLWNDPAESEDVSASHPRILAELEAIAEGFRVDLGDTMRSVVGRGVREPGRWTADQE